jgi:pimeloyl-ACP methyl ester carboxylesterase
VFEGWEGEAVDLQAGLNVAEASLLNYEAAVAAEAGLLGRPLAVVGWGLGGLAAMMAARRVEPERLVLLEPGYTEPEAPPGVRTRPESPLALAESRSGVPTPALPSRTLLVYGERGRVGAELDGAEELHLPGASHWDLVLGKTAAAEIVKWSR